MARRRRKKKLNRKLLIILVAVAAVLVGGGVYWVKFRPRDPDRFFQTGQRLAAEGDLEGAAQAYYRAQLFAARKDVEKSIRYNLVFTDHLLRYATEDKTITPEKARSLHGQRIKHLEDILRIDPENAEAAERLIGTYWQRAQYVGWWREFLDVAETRVKVAPEDAELHYHMALAHASLGARLQSSEHEQAAEAAFETATRLDPTNRDCFLDWVRYLGQRNKPTEQIEEVLRLAVEHNPHSARVLASQARFLLLDKNDVEAANRAFEQALEAPNKDASDYLEIGNYYRIRPGTLRAVQREEALRSYRQALEADPQAYDSYSAIADVLATRGEMDQAIQTLRDAMAAVEKLRGDTPAEELEMEAFHRYVTNVTRARAQLADLLLRTLSEDEAARQEALAEAKSCLEGVQKYLPQSVSAVRLEGQLAAAEGRDAEAIEKLRQAFDSIAPVDLRLAERLYDLYMTPEARLYGEAMAVIQRTVVDYPTNLVAVLRLAELQLTLYRTDEAQASLGQLAGLIEQVEQAAEEDTDNPERRETSLAMARRYRSQLDALRQSLKLALGEEVEAPAIPESISDEAIPGLLAQARILSATGRRSEAMEIWRAILRQQPTNEMAIAMLFYTHFSAGQNEQAEAVLLEAREHMPESPRLAFLLKMARAKTDEERDQATLEYIEAYETGADKEWQLAMYSRSKGDREAYLAHLERAVELDPKAVDIVNALARERILDKNFDKIEELIAKIERLGAEPGAADLLRGRVHIMKVEWDEAIVALKKVVASGWQANTARVLLAECHMRKGQLAEAEEELNISYQQNPADVPTLVALARLAERRGRTEEHERWITRAYRYAPAERYIRQHWMRYQELRQDPEQVIALGEQVRRGDPNDVQNLMMLARGYAAVDPPRHAEAQAIYRHLYESNQDPARSLGLLRLLAESMRRGGNVAEGLELLHGAAASQTDRSGYYGVVGEYLMEAGRIEDAKKAFEQMIAEDPNDYRGYQLMAGLAYRQADWNSAVDYINQSIDRRPDRRVGQQMLLDLQLRAGLYEAARKLTADILREDPNDLDALAFQGRATALTGETEPALELYDRVLNADPRHLMTRLWRFDIYRMQGRVEEAVEDLRQAFQIDRSPDSAIRLAAYYEGINDLRNARAVLEDALRANANDVSLLLQLVRLNYNVGDWDSMEAAMRVGREASPKLPTWWLQEASMWRKRGDASRRVDALARAYELAPTNAEVILAYLTGLADAGRHEQVLNTTLEIIEASRTETTIPRETVVAVMPSVARAQMALGDEAECLKAFRTAFFLCQGSEAAELTQQFGATLGAERGIELLEQWLAQGENWAMRLAMATQLQSLNRFDEARQALAKADTAAADASGRVVVHRYMGVLSYMAKDYQAAERSYRAALAVDPYDVASLNNLAYMLAEDMGRADEGLQFARQAAAIKPADAGVADTIGWVSFLVGDTAGAQRHLSRAVEMGTSGAARYHLGRVLEAQEKLSEARRQYQLGFDIVKDTPQDPLYGELESRLRALARP